VRVLLDLLFPPRCVGCGSRGDWLCRRCRASQPRLPEARCRRCAASLAGVALCPDCWRDPPGFAALTCGFRFAGPIRAGIHQLKYRRARHLAEPLVDALLEVVDGAADPFCRDSLLVPVPLHPARLAARGYNHALLLARVIAQRTRLPVDDHTLVRVRDTPAQVTLPAKERWANVRDAFALARDDLRGASVLLVDDVATTTSTLRAASRALQQGGASRVNALVVARAFNDPRVP
jgi:ComF family protein